MEGLWESTLYTSQVDSLGLPVQPQDKSPGVDAYGASSRNSEPWQRRTLGIAPGVADALDSRLRVHRGGAHALPGTKAPEWSPESRS